MTEVNQGMRILSNMFTQIVLFFSKGAQEVVKYLRKFARENAQRISALMLASKMLSVVMLLALLPLGAGSQTPKTQNSPEIKLDQTSPLAVAGKNRQVAIATGESNLDWQTKAAARKIGYSDTSSFGIERDPSYFRGLYQRAGAAYGVPWQLLEAVHYVESGASDSTTERSYAGAQGPMQFMPGTWRTWGVDGNGDGRADITNVEDAVFGAAHLLAAGGAAEGNYQSALFNYNHAQWYVDKVLGVARDAGL